MSNIIQINYKSLHPMALKPNLTTTQSYNQDESVFLNFEQIFEYFYSFKPLCYLIPT